MQRLYHRIVSANSAHLDMRLCWQGERWYSIRIPFVTRDEHGAWPAHLSNVLQITYDLSGQQGGEFSCMEVGSCARGRIIAYRRMQIPGEYKYPVALAGFPAGATWVFVFYYPPFSKAGIISQGVQSRFVWLERNWRE
ncbi:hypothetical protein GMOD_00000002 [Pyrenophora seminiperda CCB06]|uniref:Uncharacterized protein n=1 Tax=Pyrenophora seminiperda CCB06 TaxID=1302712 RepID=A0A3M7M651_9PLEO|nr:hypothetical protein GMOD_00000002 [Pyrenophora seminiperda CCB06]